MGHCEGTAALASIVGFLAVRQGRLVGVGVRCGAFGGIGLLSQCGPLAGRCPATLSLKHCWALTAPHRVERRALSDAAPARASDAAPAGPELVSSTGGR